MYLSGGTAPGKGGTEMSKMTETEWAIVAGIGAIIVMQVLILVMQYSGKI